MLFQVQREIGNNWENWSMGDDEKTPATYASLDDAIDAIRDCITDQINAVEGGDMEDSEDPSAFRIVAGKDIYDHDGRKGSYAYAINYTGAALADERLLEFSREIKALYASMEDMGDLSQEDYNAFNEESVTVNVLLEVLTKESFINPALLEYIEKELNRAFEYYLELKKQNHA